jgi:hypothetical protein
VHRPLLVVLASDSLPSLPQLADKPITAARASGAQGFDGVDLIGVSPLEVVQKPVHRHNIQAAELFDLGFLSSHDAWIVNLLQSMRQSGGAAAAWCRLRAMQFMPNRSRQRTDTTPAGLQRIVGSKLTQAAIW